MGSGRWESKCELRFAAEMPQHTQGLFFFYFIHFLSLDWETFETFSFHAKTTKTSRTRERELGNFSWVHPMEPKQPKLGEQPK
jgi:hypothetical protein